MPQQSARLNTDLDGKLTSSYYDTQWYMQVQSRDGGIASIGNTTDAEATGNGTLIGIAKRIRTLLGGGLASLLNGSGNVKTAVTESLPAGTNTIGKVSLSAALPAGTNEIGKVQVTSIPAIPAGTNEIGKVQVTSIPAIPAGTNVIGQVEVKRISQEVTILDSAERTVSGDTTATPLVVGQYQEGLFFLDVTAISGTDAKLVVTVKTKNPIADKWFVVDTFPEVTATGEYMLPISEYLGNKIAIYYAITGDTPAVTFSVAAVLKS